MKYDKQELIKGYLRTIEQNEEKIIEYSKPCDARKRRIRALERDLLKKKNKELRRKVEETKMNIKALIKKYEAVECVVGIVSGKTILKTVLRDLKQLDEPQPVKVPQCVADWIEKYKTELSLREAMSQAHVSIEVNDWLIELDSSGAFSNQDIFARAWLDGYEVEEEKRYLVKIKATKHYFAKDGNGKMFFSLAFKGCFTKKTTRRSWLRLGIRLPRD